MLKNEPMSREEQPTLTLEYINTAINRLETQYGMSSSAFTDAVSGGRDSGIYEDDVAEWEYMLQAKAEIETFLRESYLNQIDDSDSTGPDNRRTHALAA